MEPEQTHFQNVLCPGILLGDHVLEDISKQLFKKASNLGFS